VGQSQGQVLKEWTGTISASVALATQFHVVDAATDGCNVIRRSIIEKRFKKALESPKFQKLLLGNNI